MGYLYLLHFAERIGDPGRPHTTAQHYLGYAENYDRRIRKHLSGYSDASIVRYVTQQGIGIVPTRLFSGATRDLERRIKKRSMAPQLCPRCNPLRFERAISARYMLRYGLVDVSELLTPIIASIELLRDSGSLLDEAVRAVRGPPHHDHEE